MIKKILGNLDTFLLVKNSNINLNYDNFEYKKIGLRAYYCNPESDSIAILIHGLSGNQDSSYIKTLTKQLINENINVLTFDAQGTCESIQNDKFHGCSIEDNGNMDDILEWVVNKNKWKNIFTIGFSAGGGFLLNYLCKESSLYKDKILYSFFVSPTINDKLLLNYINNNAFFIYKYSISFIHSINLIKHRIYHKKFIEIPYIIKNCMFNILNSSLYGSGNFNDFCLYPKTRIKGLAIYANNDPITPKHLMDEYKNYCDVHVLEYGGHLGFYNFNDLRKHEEIILRKIKKILNKT